MKTDEHQDLLGGTPSDKDAAALLDDTPKPKAEKVKKSKPKKPAVEAKKAEDASALLDGTPKAAKTKTKKPAVEAEKAEAKPVKAAKTETKKTAVEAKKAEAKPVKAAKPKPKDKEPLNTVNVKPTMAVRHVAVLCFFTQQRCRPQTTLAIVQAVKGKNIADIEEDRRSILDPLVKLGFLLRDKKDDKYEVVREKFRMDTPDLLRFIQKIPVDPEKGLSAGVIGGKVYGKKDEEWINVRYGRAAGAVLHKLMGLGVVGYKQAGDNKPKLWYKNAQ
jgi:hypothetical protein